MRCEHVYLVKVENANHNIYKCENCKKKFAVLFTPWDFATNTKVPRVVTKKEPENVG